MTTFEEKALKDCLVVEGAVLAELASELRQDGYDTEADRILIAVIQLESDDHPIDRVRLAVPRLRQVEERLREIDMDAIADQIQWARRKMCTQADKILEDTQRLSTGEYPLIKKPDKT